MLSRLPFVASTALSLTIPVCALPHMRTAEAAIMPPVFVGGTSCSLNSQALSPLAFSTHLTSGHNRAPSLLHSVARRGQVSHAACP